MLLENVRFDPRETSKDDAERLALAKQLAELVEPDGAFVSDGFGVVHRKQASVYDVATLLPHYAGKLVEAEVKVLQQLTSSTERPYAVVLGGSKVSDKLAVIEQLAQKADSLVIGGGMCFTFLAAHGLSVGTSLVQPEMIDTCKEILETHGDVIHLPVDIVIADEFKADSPSETVAADRIPDDKMGLDIGPESVKRFTVLLSNAQTIFWNGPMGVFEFPAFAAGTKGVAEAIIGATEKGAFSVVGGGDSAAAVRALGLPEDGFSHISTGGGASLEYLEGKTLPGLEVLQVVTRKPLIAGNWKMNLNHFEAIALVQKIAFSLPEKYFDKVDVAVLPPFTDLRSVQTLVDGDKLKLTYGGQDISQHDERRLHRRDQRRVPQQARLHLRRGRALRAAHLSRRERRAGRRQGSSRVPPRAHPDRVHRRAPRGARGRQPRRAQHRAAEGLAGRADQRADRPGGDRLRTGVGHRHRVGSPARPTPRKCARPSATSWAAWHRRRSQTACGCSTAARPMPRTSATSSPRTTSTAPSSAVRRWTASSSRRCRRSPPEARCPICPVRHGRVAAMELTLQILLVVTSVLVVLLVLLHRAKGGGLSTLFGGGVQSSLSGSTVVEKNLDRVTYFVTAIWVISIVGVGLMIKYS